MIDHDIPKIKFIAGDQTGYGVFYTNYHTGMKAGTVLEMWECEFNYFQESLEISNRNNVRKIDSGQNIRVNIHGYSLNKALGPGLSYPILSRFCVLASQVV